MASYRVLLLALATLLLAAGGVHAQNDRVRTAERTESGEITKMTAAAVTVKRGSQSKTVPVNEIQSVQFGGEPSELTQARVNARNGGYAAALKKLSGLDAGSISNKYIAAEVAFFKAYCQAKLALLGEADVMGAGRQLNGFIQKNKQNFHYLQATELLGDLLTAAGRYSNAEQMYGQLARAPFPEYKVRASVLIGRTLQAQDKHAEALQRFESALASADDSPRGKTQRLSALLGKAVSLAATGKVNDGVGLVNEVLKNADPAESNLLASAYNALGSCYLKAGKPKDALFAFLHVDLLFANEPEAHAESLYHLATLWEEIGKTGQAREARNKLKSRYAASSWAKRI